MKNKYLELFLLFAKISLSGIGGGYAMLPILKYELTEKRGWVTEDEMQDYYAAGQCTPGIIAVNVSTFVGIKRLGIAGGIAATLGMVAPSLVFMSAVAGIFSFASDFLAVKTAQYVLMGIRTAVVAYVSFIVWEFVRGGVVNAATFVIFMFAAVSAFFGVTPPVIVILAGAAGVALNKKKM